MKRTIRRGLAAVLFTAAMVLTACSGGASAEKEPTTEPTVTVQPDPVTTAPTTVPEPEKTLTALELAEKMGNGINLGNTMEAYGRSTVGTSGTVTQYETAWGQPITTQEMVSGMKAAGFDTLRIPVAWTNTMQFEDGDYTIREDYLERVREIVDYAISEDMYVILNDHWDGGWWGMFGSATEGTRLAAMDLYTSMWTQIAEYFADYGDQLIFESANEELGGRLNDKDIAADSGTLSDEECYSETNRINQAFVDTIRSCGGNNKTRFLLIAGYGTDIAGTCNSKYQMPTDSANQRLLISVHYYEPSAYCINGAIDSWGTKEEYERQNELLSMMTKFTEQGYGVVIGEYGVLMTDGVTTRPDTKAYLENFLNNCDLYGYVPVLWDTGNAYNRYTCSMRDAETAQLYLERSAAAQANIPAEELRQQAQEAITKATEQAQAADTLGDDTAMAWLMYSAGDWAISYSVGDEYAPGSATAGLVATDVVIEGAGTYTVSLDLTKTAGGVGNGITFMALGIANGEALFPGYVIIPQKFEINGEEVPLSGLAYTTSDDGLCTRINIYNAWVTKVPPEARVIAGNAAYGTPTLLSEDYVKNVKIETVSLTFRYQAK